MNFWEKVTGSDMTKEARALELRAKKLSVDYRDAWEEVKANIWIYSSFSGRNLMPILDGILFLLEEAQADKQSVEDVLGDDIAQFCAALAGEKGAKSYRDKWREQLNNAVAKKLTKEETK